MKNFFIKSNINLIKSQLKYAKDIDEFISILELENNKTDISNHYQAIIIFINRFHCNVNSLNKFFNAFNFKFINIQKEKHLNHFYYNIEYQNPYGKLYTIFINISRLKNEIIL